MIQYSRQFIDTDDILAVTKVLKSRLITQGPLVEKFEKKISKLVECKYATAVNSSTSGLHVACLAMGLKKNDHLWTVPNTFVASANCGRFCGAKVDFVDIDIKTLNICEKELLKKLVKAKKEKKLPKIIVVVHFAGNPCNLIQIKKLSIKYGFKIIEDASHALGSFYKKKPIGNCKYSDASVFSFHPVKPITTCEGGVVTTNSLRLKNSMDLFRSHGIVKEHKNFVQNNYEPWKYEQQFLGYNYRMNEIQAALGISQLKKIKKFVSQRNKIATYYKKKLNNKKIMFQKILDGNKSSYHLMILTLRLDIIKKSYKDIFNYLRKSKIGINLHYYPVHLQPYYLNHCGRLNMKNSENYYKTSFSVPLYYNLKKTDVDYVIKKINNIIE